MTPGFYNLSLGSFFVRDSKVNVQQDVPTYFREWKGGTCAQGETGRRGVTSAGRMENQWILGRATGPDGSTTVSRPPVQWE